MSTFDASKESILENLSVGVDFSFKGSIDAPILELVHFLNSMKDYFTTSSCSGRVSVFRSGLSAKQIKWILVKHRLFTKSEVLGAVKSIDGSDQTEFSDSLVTLKCEAFILHINCRDLESAKSLHNIATLCGFRESGIKLGNKKIILAVRTTANGMELPIAKGNELIVSDSYLDLIINECNARLASNFYRIDKFLLELKKQHRWPILQVMQAVSTGSSSHGVVRRWGHTCCSIKDSSSPSSGSNSSATAKQTGASRSGGGVNSSTRSGALVLGGYGCDGADGGDKCKRGLQTLLLPSTDLGGQGELVPGVVDDSMHAVAVTLQLPAPTQDLTVLLLCGGRRSPGETSAEREVPLLRAYNVAQGYAAVECVVSSSGGAPGSRWGHSLTLVRDNLKQPVGVGGGDGGGSCTYLLYGGRNSEEVVGDAYLLHIQQAPIGTNPNATVPAAVVLQCTWEKLNLTMTAQSGEAAGAGASAGVVVGAGDESDTHLPPLLLPEPRFFHAACATLSVFPAYDTQTNEYNMVVVHGGLLSIHDTITCGKAFLIDPNIACVSSLFLPQTSVPASTTSANPAGDNTEEAVAAAADGGGGNAKGASSRGSVGDEVRRFGHSLTSVGAKCLVLVGGASFQPSEGQEDNKTLIFDLFIDATGRYRASFRSAEVVNHTTSAGGDGNMLPCQACRVHHQAVFDAHCRTLQVVGGGAMTLAFGAHFCASLRVQLRTAAELAAAGASAGAAFSAATVGGAIVGGAVTGQKAARAASSASSLFLASLEKEQRQQQQSASPVLFAPAATVRALKVYFEALKQLDKSRSIAKVEESVLKSSFSSAGRPVRVPLTAGSSAALNEGALSAEEAEQLLQSELHESRNMMAIPLAAELYSLLIADPSTSTSTSTSSVVTGALKREEVLAEVCRICAADNILLGHYATRTSKRTQVNSAQKANDLLTALAQAHQLPVCANSSTQELHSRFEVVGDVLMLPEHYLTGPHWERILGLQITTDSVGVVNVGAEDSPAAQYRRQVFGTLAQCFGLSRVARKAEIDSGPKRESKVRLLHPILGMAATTGPNSLGWVVVYENKISYGFDITRVMFCSGNVTERMRMAHQASQQQVVVDFYCGIGYYTVPLLRHGQAKHVHACEWNPNSVLALRENLRRAGVSDRCTVYEGDNRISAEGLVDVADRVLLGLLPSSVQGWPLAARALKPTGGTIHVHENVLESILTIWVEETRLQFEAMLRALPGKQQLSVRVLHLEKVKSYAPRVYHVVLDLACE